MAELKIKWKEFLIRINFLIKEGDNILNISPRGNEEEIKFINEYDLWRKKVIEYLDEAFGERNIYTREFKYVNQNKFNFSEQKNDSQINLRELKQDFGNDIRYLNYNKNILTVSDLITKPTQVDISRREHYTSEEISELILEKLYDLYDDNSYAILPILEGNGIKLKKKREEFEYVKLLEHKGYVQSNYIAREIDAQLTIYGKLYIEDKRKVTKPNYELISNDQEIIKLKFDELIIRLEKLGFGQQIIFDELEELKNLYTTLDKKNWGQLVKGKIIDLGLSQVIDGDVMKIIYEHITNGTLRLP